ncbi:MAG: intein-containing DNA gyrase subunit A, partial [Actinomycetes bacterium]
GDSAIYDTLVRLAQPWAMRLPLVDGQGNFGSPGNDPPAAMRYCLTADARLTLADGATVRIADIVPDAAPNSDNDIELKVRDRSGLPVRATKLFHSGAHPTLSLTTREGYSLTGTHNHPVLCLVNVGDVPTLLWKLLEEIEPGDSVVLSRASAVEWGYSGDLHGEAFLAGAFVSEGFVSASRAGFNNTDQEFFDRVVELYDRHVGGRRYVSSRILRSGSRCFELDIHQLDKLEASCLASLQGQRSAAKSVPEFVWSSPLDVKAAFLQALFTGDGSASALARNSVQISYSTCSQTLATQVQDLLLEFGIVARLCRYASGEIKVVISNRRDARIFNQSIGFFGVKGEKLRRICGGLPTSSTSLSRDLVPGVAAFLRAHGGEKWGDRDWLRRHNLDRVERWERNFHEILDHVSPEAEDVIVPLVDGRFYYATVEAVRPAGVQDVYSLRVDTDDHSFITNGFVSHNTECRMAPLAMEMVRDIDEDTVDFQPNYDGRSSEPLILPSRFPNLLVNGSAGIAVGMATNIPPHNLREVAAGVQWFLDNPEATHEELLTALLQRITGPDFPTGALIMGRRGIEEAYRTGRGSITMRAVVEVEEIQGRQCLVITELPYQVNPDNLALKIAELVKDGRIQGIADVRDETSSRTGQRLVIVLKRDAVAKVVLNNLYKHTQLQDNFSANMLALVDGVPRTLSLDGFVRHWVAHQIDVIVRRTRFRLRKAEERAHILRALLKALDRIDEVIALIRASESADVAKTGLMDLLEIDDVQAGEILNMQLRRLAALERQNLLDQYDELMRQIEEYQAILASEERQRQIVSEELAAIVERYGDERRTRIIPFDGDMSMEDLIPEEPVVVTITRGGYAKRTKVDLYRSQRRGGKGVKGAQLRGDDVVEHFFVTTTHHWVLFFTDKGRVYRSKAYELPEAGRDAKGQHVANLMAFQPDEQIAAVLTLRDYEVADYLVLATEKGYVKKTRLGDYDSNRSGGIIAISFKDEDDKLIGARLVSADDDLLLVSRKGQSVRFRADDGQLRPMGRATGGVTGMRFRDGDSLLAVSVVRADIDGIAYLVTVTDGGYAKRTRIDEYRLQGRGGMGIKAARLNDERGQLVGAFVAVETDEVLVVMASGKVVRTPVSEVPPKGRDTMGVILAKPDNGDAIVAVARNAEPVAEEEIEALPTDVVEVPAADQDEVLSDEARAPESGPVQPDEGDDE